ncbi:MAG TPA: alpha/beta fold hydrolase [Terriglobales bacterium]|nr:alpha/beta fold hydrolase [Terriglobales bacterium]
MSHLNHKIPGNGASDARINPRDEFAAEEHWITLDNAPGTARMRYLRAGSGPALLLVHGLLGYSFSWRFTIPALAGQATVYAIDMLGTGFSDRPAKLDCSFTASAKRLLQFMDKTGLASCDLLGTSHGGAVCMTAAALAPDRFRRLILVDPVNPWSAHGRRLTVLLSNLIVAPLFVNLAPHLPSLHEFYHRRMFGDPRRIPPDSLEGYRRPLRIPGSFEYALAVTRSWNRDLRELESALPRIAHLPTLLIWGSLDTAVDPASAVQLKQRFRNCQLMTFDGVGHLPYEEAPEEFNHAVAEFLSLKFD